MFVARIGRLDGVTLGADGEQQVHQFLERDIGGVGSGPASPAQVVAHPLFRDAAKGVVQRLDVELDPFAIVAAAVHHDVVQVGQDGVVHLYQESGVDDDLIFLVLGVSQREQELLLGLVVVVCIAHRDAARRDDRQEGLLHLDPAQRRLQVLGVAPHVGPPLVGVGDGAGAQPLHGRRAPLQRLHQG